MHSTMARNPRHQEVFGVYWNTRWQLSNVSAVIQRTFQPCLSKFTQKEKSNSYSAYSPGTRSIKHAPNLLKLKTKVSKDLFCHLPSRYPGVNFFSQTHSIVFVFRIFKPSPSGREGLVIFGFYGF